MKKFRILTVITVILTTAHLWAPVVTAHPLGNFTINHYAGLRVGRQAILIDYVVDMAEIPAFQEIATFDTNHNGQAEANEAAAYHQAKCGSLQPSLQLSLNGHPLTLALTSSAVEFPPGAGGLPTLRLSCGYQAPVELTTAEKAAVLFENNAYSERRGWREIVVTSDGVSLEGDLTAMTHSLSQRLSAYPDDLLASPLDQREVRFGLAPAAASDQGSSQSTMVSPPANSAPVDRNDGFTRLITLQNLTGPSILLALALAFIWGAAHALTPGHGKTLVAAYLVGSRGTVQHALFLGLTTTITHTAGVFILGFLTLFASQFILPEQLYPWLGVASGVLIVSLGLSLFRGRLNSFLRGSPRRQHDHHHHHHHGHDDHHHDHAHDHHDRHSHLPPGADNAAISWRSLLALGISGGLIPCPSALVVMLSAIALQRIGFGLLLIVTFSLGLAGVLTAIGVVWVQARQLFDQFSGRGLPFGQIATRGRLLQALPAASALFITIVGVGITLKALLQIGLLS